MSKSKEAKKALAGMAPIAQVLMQNDAWHAMCEQQNVEVLASRDHCDRSLSACGHFQRLQAIIGTIGTYVGVWQGSVHL